MKVGIQKRFLRLFLAAQALILPVLLVLGRLLSAGKPVLLSSISSYYFTEVRYIFLIIMILFGLAFIIYGLSYSVDRLILILTGVITLCVAFFPTVGPGGEHNIVSYFHIVCAVGFFFLLGWTIRYTFNLPIAFPLLTKFGLFIWIAEGVLIIYFLFLKSLWPPLVFILEAIILWMFTGGIYVRWQIDKRLKGGK